MLVTVSPVAQPEPPVEVVIRLTPAEAVELSLELGPTNNTWKLYQALSDFTEQRHGSRSWKIARRYNLSERRTTSECQAAAEHLEAEYQATRAAR